MRRDSVSFSYTPLPYTSHVVDAHPSSTSCTEAQPSRPPLPSLFSRRAGDILILATDGFSDNVFPAELEQLVALVSDKVANPSPEEQGQPGAEDRGLAQTLADVATQFARICSMKVGFRPFATNRASYAVCSLESELTRPRRRAAEQGVAV